MQIVPGECLHDQHVQVETFEGIHNERKIYSKYIKYKFTIRATFDQHPAEIGQRKIMEKYH